MLIFLETPRLLLRRFTEADLDNLVDLDSDPAVMRFLNGGTPTPRDVIERETLPRFLRSYHPVPGLGVWATVEKASGDFIGWLALRSPEGGPLDEAELGYRLRRVAWGKGYATEGSRALIDKAFSEVPLRRIFAGTMTINHASRRVMEHCGLSFVRTFFEEWSEPIEGSEHGEVEYALTKSDWEHRAGIHTAGPRRSPPSHDTGDKGPE